MCLKFALFFSNSLNKFQLKAGQILSNLYENKKTEKTKDNLVVNLKAQ